MNKEFARKQLSFATIVFVMTLSTIAPGQSSYRTELRKWRTERENKLKAEEGWLSVAGLFWLKEGVNTFGTDPSQNIRLPENSAPPKVGALELRAAVVSLHVAAGAQIKVNDQPATELVLQTDANGAKPDVMTIGDLKLTVIKRADRIGLRVRDKNSRARREFKGLRWFPVRESLRIVATFTPFDQPKEMTILNVLGDEVKMTNPGILSFELQGRKYQLKPVMENDDELLIIFRDRTAGRSTYAAGRFLYAAMPRNGKVVLDFNKAENPPCAFTAFATCPLPPRQNFLPITIEAGELNYHLNK